MIGKLNQDIETRIMGGMKVGKMVEWRKKRKTYVQILEKSNMSMVRRREIGPPRTQEGSELRLETHAERSFRNIAKPKKNRGGSSVGQVTAARKPCSPYPMCQPTPCRLERSTKKAMWPPLPVCW